MQGRLPIAFEHEDIYVELTAADSDKSNECIDVAVLLFVGLGKV
jgi:hypothetical protein